MTLYKTNAGKLMQVFVDFQVQKNGCEKYDDIPRKSA